MKWMLFLNALRPHLVELAKFLYVRFKGDADAATKEISRVRDYWSNWDQENARIDADLEKLRQEGK